MPPDITWNLIGCPSFGDGWNGNPLVDLPAPNVPSPRKNKALRNKAHENPLVSLCFLNKALLFIKPLFLRGVR